MVIAVGSVRVMQVPVDNVVDVVSMWHGRVSTVRSVDVPLRMSSAVMSGRTGIGVFSRDGQLVFQDRSVGMRVMHVPIVQVV